MFGLVGEVGVTNGGEYGVVTKEFLYLDQIDAGLDQVGGIAMSKRVGRDLFFRPQAATT